MPDTEPGRLAPGAPITDRLVVIRHLGSGGLGAVYEVEHKFTRHRRAVKVLHPKFRNDPEVVGRFLNEASAAGRIGNPHIVETFDAGLLEDGSPYLVMEFLEGRPLDEVLRWSGRLDAGLAAALMVQICGAVQAAHDAKIIHRDLKPENLFLSARNGEAFIRVLDFGISKFGGEPGGLRQTRSGMTMGTPLYMPPEQLRGAKDADARSDVYSLGVILYEMVSGHVPFVANSFAELAVKVLSSEAPSLDLGSGAIPSELSAHVTRALEKDPALRFQTAAEFGAALAPLAKNQGVAQLLEEHAPGPVAPAGDTFVRLPVSDPGPPAPRASAPLPPARAVTDPQFNDAGPIPPPAQRVASLEPIHTARPRGPLLAGIGAALVVAAAGVFVVSRGNGHAAHPVTAIAVLPFDNTTGDPENEYLSDGLTESVIYQLSRASSLRVMPRSSVYRARSTNHSPVEAGKALGVEVVVSGELTPKLVRAELVEVGTGALRWGHRWDRESSDLIVIQREIAEGTQGALTPADGRTSGSPPPVAPQPSDPEAFRLYLKGRFYWNKRTADGLEKAAALFQEALDRDPRFAAAWVGLGDSIALLDQYAGVPSRVNCPKAKAAIARALELEPGLAPAHASHALLLGHCDWEWTQAEAEFKRALELDPRFVTAHHWYALHLTYRGLFDRALTEAHTAQQLDPLSLIANNASSVVNGYAGRWDLVVEQSDRLIAMDASFPIAHIWKGRALRAKGQYPAALAELQKAFDLSDQRWFELMGDLGATEALAGNRAGANLWSARLVEALERNPSGRVQLAMISASLGEKQEALDWLDKAFETGSWFLVQLQVEPLFAPLRAEPRFIEMVKKVKVETPSPPP